MNNCLVACRLLSSFALVALGLAACESSVPEPAADEPDAGAVDNTPDAAPNVLVECDALPLDAPFEYEPGPREMVAGEMYVVHSGMVGVDGLDFYESSNIFVIRGELVAGKNEVWVFGSGYGDPDGDVIRMRETMDAMRSALADGEDVDGVIQGCMKLNPADVAIRFITPHFHLDHINQGLFTALRDLGYAWEKTRVFVHAADYDLAFCGADCRGSATTPPWEEELVARGEALGAIGDACNVEVLSFDTPTLGRFSVVHAHGHTDGTLHLDNSNLGVRLIGAGDLCDAPADLRRVGIHGPVEL